MIGIIGFESLRVMQYLKKYTKILDEKGIDYEVVYWNRTGEKKPDEHYIAFEKPIDSYVPFKYKMFKFLKYTLFLYTILRTRKYERLIVLTTQTAIVLSPVLLTIYKGRYIYDYRDITLECYSFYKFIVKKLFHHSYQNVISSPGFIKHLRINTPYILSHNNSHEAIIHSFSMRKDVIRLVYWGMIRQVEFNKKICDLFGNDSRFCVVYHGEGYYKEIEAYCKNKRYSNITFTGAYNAEEITSFARETDILLNTYENDWQQKPALTVKLYDGLRFQLPMLITKESFMELYLNKYDVSYALSLESITSKDEIFEWYNQLDQSQLEKEYNLLNSFISKDNENFEKVVAQFGSCK